MNIDSYVNWTLVGLFFIGIIKADENPKEEELFLERTNDLHSIKSKRPFCNAFTGCGRKRSYDSSLQHGRDGFPAKLLPLFNRVLMQAINEEIRRSNDRQLNNNKYNNIDNNNNNNLLNLNDQDYSDYYSIRKLPRK